MRADVGYLLLDGRCRHAARPGSPDRPVAQHRGDVSVSFGGQINDELAVVCRNVDALTDAYASVVDRYTLSSIDLDIEGPALADIAALERRAQAIAALQAEAVAGVVNCRSG